MAGPLGDDEEERLSLNRNCITALFCATPGGIFPLLAPNSKDLTVKQILFPSQLDLKSRNMASRFFKTGENWVLNCLFLSTL